MIFKHPKLKSRKLVVTSNLAKLLQERGMSQKELSRLTGVSERAISRIKSRIVVNRIDCTAAVKICIALSSRRILKLWIRVPVRLDMLFPIKQISNKNLAALRL